jgi:hypothetical protein
LVAQAVEVKLVTRSKLRLTIRPTRFEKPSSDLRTKGFSFWFLKSYSRRERFLTDVVFLWKSASDIMGIRSLVAVLLFLLAFLNVEVLAAGPDSGGLTIADIPACGVSSIYSLKDGFMC